MTNRLTPLGRRPRGSGTGARALVAATLFAALGAWSPEATASGLPKLGESAALRLPAPDVTTLLAEDALAEAAGEPLRFARPAEVLVTPSSSGAWDVLDDGSRIWRLRVSSPGATDLNLGFTRYRLPQGATLTAVAEHDGRRVGPYTADDNEAHGELWTPPLPGDSLTLELVVPPATEDWDLELGQVGIGYRDVTGRFGGGIEPTNHGECNNDVVCPVGDPWRDQIRSVATYSFGGSRICTGSLIADVPGSLRPWFLTAWHCMRPGDAPSMVVFWNYESSTCDGPDDGPLDQNQTGATFRATWRDSDLMLVELDDMPDPAHAVFYSGWDATDTAASGAVGIHHPRLHSKSISFENDPLDKVNSCIGTGGVDSHWRVNDWDDGTTEGGSSGSGIWDPVTQRLIGTLSGGGAACGNDLSDCYGRFAVHWTGGGADDSRLSNWLDPAGTGTLAVDGIDPSGAVRARLDSFSGADSCSLGAGDGNGEWEPGEEIDLAVVVEVVGGPATNVAGVLTSPTPGVTILDDTADWPDFPGAGAQESLAPHFRLRLDEPIACFDQIDLVVTLTSDAFDPTDLALSQTIGTPAEPDVPQPVSRSSPAISALTIGDAITLSSVAVRVVIDHTWVGDLEIALRSPSGTLVTLLDRPGVPASGAGCDDEDMDVTFTDGAGMGLEDHCPGTTPWFVGEAIPVDPLAALAGETAEGTWTLEVRDEADGDSGSLVDWDLLTTPALSAGECLRCELVPCDGVALESQPLRVSKRPGGEVVLDLPDPISPCAEGVAVYRAATPRPDVGSGLFPDDPAFADVTGDDLDPAPDAFRHVPPGGPSYYLVVEALPDGGRGPSGHYPN